MTRCFLVALLLVMAPQTFSCPYVSTGSGSGGDYTDPMTQLCKYLRAQIVSIPVNSGLVSLTHCPAVGAYIGHLGPDLAAAQMNSVGPNKTFLYISGFNHIYWPANASAPLQFSAEVNGVTQLAAVSHVGPALASLVEIYQDDDETSNYDYLIDLAAILNGVMAAQDAISVEYWTEMDPDVLGTYAERLAEKVGAGLGLVQDFLERAIQDPSETLTYDNLVSTVLDPSGELHTFNSMMISTFALANLLADYYTIN